MLGSPSFWRHRGWRSSPTQPKETPPQISHQGPLEPGNLSFRPLCKWTQAHRPFPLRGHLSEDPTSPFLSPAVASPPSIAKMLEIHIISLTYRFFITHAGPLQWPLIWPGCLLSVGPHGAQLHHRGHRIDLLPFLGSLASTSRAWSRGQVRPLLSLARRSWACHRIPLRSRLLPCS